MIYVCVIRPIFSAVVVSSVYPLPGRLKPTRQEQTMHDCTRARIIRASERAACRLGVPVQAHFASSDRLVYVGYWGADAATTAA